MDKTKKMKDAVIVPRKLLGEIMLTGNDEKNEDTLAHPQIRA